jgi:hypothetical protein
MADGENTDLNTENLQTPAHGRGKLAPPWRPGQSGNPGGRPRGARWLRKWCQTLLVNHGLQVFAAAVKRGDLVAIRLALAYAYGNPAVDLNDGEDETEAAGREVALDLAGAEAAVAPPPLPRTKTRAEEVEDAIIAKAEADQRRAIRLLGTGLTPGDLQRAVEEDRRRGGWRE